MPRIARTAEDENLQSVGGVAFPLHSTAVTAISHPGSGILVNEPGEVFFFE
jgi:hypothetical protein